jgi:sugar lactone lactonase YvrE
MVMTTCNKAVSHNPPGPQAGSVTTTVGPTFAIYEDGGSRASFNGPTGVAVVYSGYISSRYIYVADQVNNMIRKIGPFGVTIFAGNLNPGSLNGNGTAASFDQPSGVAVDAPAAGENVYVADQNNNMIRKITSSGIVSTLAGSGSPGATDGPGGTASFNKPAGVAVDGAGNVYVADYGNNLIREISPTGVVSTLAGTGSKGSANGPSATASFNSPTGVAVDGSGNVYVADYGNNLIREISPSGVVSTLAGNGSFVFSNGIGTAASFSGPFGIAIDGAGNLYVAEQGNQIIRKITPNAVVSIFAGSGKVGATNGIDSNASFWYPSGVAVDAFGYVYVADRSNELIRQVDTMGITTTLAGDKYPGYVNAFGTLNGPTSVATDAQGNVYFSDCNDNLILEFDTLGDLSNLAGNGIPGSNNGVDPAASFWLPYGITSDATGNVYVADRNNNMIREISRAGVVTTLAGNPLAGSTNGTGTGASFNSPSGVAIDGSGNIFVADSKNNLIRKINPAGGVSTLAGSGSSGSTNGMGTAASFNNPTGVAVDMAGNVYVADHGNNLIRKISPVGMVSTLAGSGSQGSSNATGVAASFNQPIGIAVDPGGTVYVADFGNNLIRAISTSGIVSTLAGTGSAGSSDGSLTTASFSGPTGIAVDGRGNVYVADFNNNAIRRITP